MTVGRQFLGAKLRRSARLAGAVSGLYLFRCVRMGIAMTEMLLITSSISLLAISGTFAAIIYYDAWTERRLRSARDKRSV